MIKADVLGEKFAKEQQPSIDKIFVLDITAEQKKDLIFSQLKYAYAFGYQDGRAFGLDRKLKEVQIK